MRVRILKAAVVAAVLSMALLSLAQPGPEVMIPAGSDWRYWDSADYPGAGWKGFGFEDSGWKHGPGMLGFGDANGTAPNTVIADTDQWVSYFRHAFTLADPALYTGLKLSLQRDDGAVVYLNGVELWRENMPLTGSILPNTPASSVVGGADETRWWTTNVAASALVAGTNLLAVEVHQQNLGSSDLAFDFELEGLNDNLRPELTAPANYLLSEAPATLLLVATVRDDGLPLPADAANPDPNDAHKLRWHWSVLSAPPASSGVVWSGSATNGEAFTYAGSPNLPQTVFTCAPSATFDVPGLYVLEFRATDGDKEAGQQVAVLVRSTADHREAGYLYLSPLPGSEYTSPQTRFVLVRFANVAPGDITNLSSFIQVTGATSGDHSGQTKIATDGRTIIFTMTQNFANSEAVTVTLSPAVAPGTSGAVEPYQYQFMTSTHFPDPDLITARGEGPPAGVKENAFDGNPSTKWVDSVVPTGAANFTWIQLIYPGFQQTKAVDQYALTSANDAPERDPRDWRLLGVDAANNLVLLDTQTNQTFVARGERKTFPIANLTAYRGYRLEITRVNDPQTATGVQLAELELRERAALLREVWTGITGANISDLTSQPSYPDNPNISDYLTTFEAPTDWAEHYGTRVRGYLIPPVTGDYTFWIATDDAGQLWLSTNALPANRRLIAQVTGWTSARQWDKYGEQKSSPIRLIAGQQYYVEALQKEHEGGDNLAVGWAKPGQSTTAPSEVIPGAVLSAWGGGSLSSAFAQSAADDPPILDPGIVGAAGEADPPLPFEPSPGPGSDMDGPTEALPNGVSVPSDFPHINITINDSPDSGHIFLDNRGGGGRPYNVIFNNSGYPIWYRRMPDERRDMKVQQNGVLTMLARTGGYRFAGLNTNYQEIASYSALNGYGTDEHELVVLKDGRYLLIGVRGETVDMSRYLTGGNMSASVNETVIQEFTAAGELIFQWRAWDHYDVRDVHLDNPTSSSFRFPHMNAIEVDTDGHILVSCRHISEVTKINRDTGDIIWRLGGAHSDFGFVNDPLNGFRNQHSIRTVGTNRYILFDNGDLHSPQVSRGVEYVLDLQARTATVVWQYPTTPTSAYYSHYMANVQRLPNGNTLINWAVGHLPKLTEVRPNGTKAFEMNWVDGYEAYRVWRCPWQGSATEPYLILEPQADNLTLLFNQFGDTNVAYYRIYGGTSPQPTTLLATSSTTLKRLTSLENGRRYYFRVTAVNGAGVEGGFSNEENLIVNILKPGENLLQNGDFASGTESWSWFVSGGASAEWRFSSGASWLDIAAGGSSVSSVQLLQAGIQLLQGRTYVFEFDAWSQTPRYIEAKVGQDQSPFASYKVSSPSLTPVQQHFTYSFVMANASDLNARLSFNCGASTQDVYLDNVSLWMVAIGDFNLDRCVNYDDLAILNSQWLRQGTGLSADLNGDGRVDSKDFVIFGENWPGGNCP